MKVLLINGSPNEKGCTYTALCEVEKEMNKAGIETEIFHIGNKPIQSCTACGGCRKLEKPACVFTEDSVNTVIEKAKVSDGFIFGSPVHYAGPSGALTALLGRCFFAGSRVFAYKPGACVVSCRRGGSTASFDSLNKFFTISNMPVVSSQYWNMVHGTNPEQVQQDLEGLQIMRTLGKNMVWLLKCIEVGKQNGIHIPEQEARINTNFIR